MRLYIIAYLTTYVNLAPDYLTTYLNLPNDI